MSSQKIHILNIDFGFKILYNEVLALEVSSHDWYLKYKFENIDELFLNMYHGRFYYKIYRSYRYKHNLAKLSAVKNNYITKDMLIYNFGYYTNKAIKELKTSKSNFKFSDFKFLSEYHIEGYKIFIYAKYQNIKTISSLRLVVRKSYDPSFNVGIILDGFKKPYYNSNHEVSKL